MVPESGLSGEVGLSFDGHLVVISGHSVVKVSNIPLSFSWLFSGHL